MSKFTLTEQTTAPDTPATNKVRFYAKSDRMLYSKDDAGLEARVNEVKGSDVASAATINLDAATGNLVDVTGTTTITAVTLSEGKECTVRFTGALTLTDGASLILPNNGSDISTAAGDFAIFRGYAAGIVRCVVYQKVNGTAVSSNLFTLGTETTLSGTAVDFTGLPSTLRVIYVMFDGASHDGTSGLLIQIGDSGGVETTGYVSDAVRNGTAVGTTTSGFLLTGTPAADDFFTGLITLTLLDSTNNTWVSHGGLAEYSGASTGVNFSAGKKTSLNTVLDRIRITSVTPNTWDGGSVNILYA